MYGQMTENRIQYKKAAEKTASWFWKIGRGLLLFGLSFVILYPLLYMLSMTFRPGEQIFDPTVIWLPKSLTLDNLRKAYELMKYPQSIRLSLSVNVVCSLMQVAICAITGYGFARFQFFGKHFFFILVILTMLVPSQIIVMPMFLNFRTMGLLNTVWCFYIPAALGAGLKSGLFVFIFRQFFSGLPKELEDAAAIDGCGFFACFLRVIIPNAVTVCIMASLLSIMWYWNDYFTSSMYMSDLSTLSVMLVRLKAAGFADNNNVNDPYSVVTLMQAGSLMVVLPILTLFLALQRFFVQGVERSGIVG